ncbi:MAG: TonB-dependent receptor [Bacteroidetes bacterium]|jgi:iron complex outermembrane receptor protein|nr:TonB-dependent receptor [Bacteroidota bacterium]
MTRWTTCLLLVFLGLTHLAVAQDGRITGSVWDADTDEPLPGANVLLEDTNRGTSTTADGTYAIENVPPGTYTLLARFVGYREATVEVTVRAGATTEQDILLEETVLLSEELVVTGSREAEKVLEAPVTIETITAENLETTGGGTFLSALSTLKGIDFVEVGINGQGISARGFNNHFNTRMLSMVDGRVAQLPGTGLPQGNFLPTAPLDVKSIEVVVGPASALYGPNAHTGVVNVITKDPWDQSGLSMFVRGGQRELLDGTFRAAGLVNQDLGWKVTGQYLEANDFEPDPESSTHFYGTDTNPALEPVFEGDLVDDLDGYRINSWKVDGSLYYRFSDWQLKGGYGFSENDNFGLTNNGRNHIRDWQVQYQTLQLSNPNWYAQVTRTENDAGDTYQLNAVAQGAGAVMATTGQSLDQVDLESLREANSFVDRGVLYDSEIQYRRDISDLTLITGVQYRNYQPDSDGTFLADANDEDIDATEFGGYLQLDYKTLDDRLRLVGAARVDDHSNYDTQISPKAAAVYTVAPAQNIRVSYNRAFKSPTVLENNLFIPILAAPGYYLNALGNIDGYVIKNPTGETVRTISALEPEEVNAAELGYKGVFANRVYVDVVGYYSWYQNFISPLSVVADGINTIPFEDDGTTPVTAPADDAALNGLLTYVNFGEAEIAGLDVGVNVYASDYLTLSGNVSLISLESFTLDESSAQDSLLLNIPETKLKGVVTLKDYGLDNYFVSVSGRWQAPYKFRSGYWDSELFYDDGEVPSRFVLNLTAGYTIPQYGLSIKASVTNLLDDEGVDVLGSPIRGRFAWVGIEYAFAGLRF